jgi:hypothetical protein
VEETISVSHRPTWSHSTYILWKPKPGYKHLTIRFTKSFAEITAEILYMELEHRHGLYDKNLVIVERRKMTDKMMEAWKHERHNFEYYGGDVRGMVMKRPPYQYDIYVREEVYQLVKYSVR